MTTPLFTDLGGETWRICRFVDESDKRWSAFNPCIAYSPEEGYVVLLRSSNYFFDPKTGDTVATIGTRVKNRMFLANLNKDWQIIEETLRELDFSKVGHFLRGPEDGRLYWRDGHWEILSVMREPHISDDVPRLATYKLNGTTAEMVKLHTAGDIQPIEKNWMPTYEKNPNFDFIYSAASVYNVDVGKVKVREATEQAGNNIRGGSCLWDLGKKYLAITHEAIITKERRYIARMFEYRAKVIRTYVHRFATYDKNGKLLELSDPFSFQGANVEFAAGLVLSGDDVIVSYGYKDVAAYLGKIKLDAVIAMLKAVK
jgi:hypothetical protein